jgi:flagellar biosynthesis/type III secretory pathway protein FliH
LEQGIERGIEQGIEQGREKEREKIIRKMVSLGYPVEEITQIYERKLVEKVLAERKEKE